MSSLTCQFCSETDFDKPGLANHLFADCEGYSASLSEFRASIRERDARILEGINERTDRENAK